MNNRPELLAPAGDLEKMRFAIAYGADAVYLAGQRFGMRAAAANFDDNALREGIAYAHARGVKCYITVNIMPSCCDLPALPAYLELLQDAGADALIVADVGVIRLAQKYAPKVPLHISTQTSILNHEAANFWADLGAERVVLARELSLEEIAEIRAKTPKTLEIEAFVHGAMCISYSGRCLISQYMTGRDANHGACAQPCRWNYALMEEQRPGEFFPVEEDARGTYLYNSKDMCMIEHIPELVRAGIDSFKIEGRNKTAYYAACVTGAYRAAIDAYRSDPAQYKLPQFCRDEVDKVSHRHYSTGFYYGQPGQFTEDSRYIRDWQIVAKVLSCDGEGNALLTLNNKFSTGDTLELVGPDVRPVSFQVGELRDEEGNVLEQVRKPQMRFTLKLPQAAPPLSLLRRQADLTP